ncbi:hypothetical protein Voja6_00120 [Pseudomonas phage vB_PpuM-Voja-6]
MAMEILPSIQLVPEQQRNHPVFQKVAAIMDFISLTNHYANVEEMVDRFNIQGDAYDPGIGADEFGADEIKRILSAAGAAIEDRSLVGVTRMIYRLKGTSRGLVFILRLLGIGAIIYEGTRVQREIELQTANGVAWADDPELVGLNNCEILIGLEASPTSAPDLLTEAQLLVLAREFMWVCSNIIGFKLGVNIKDIVPFTEDIEEQINEDIRQPFRVGKLRDYPYPPFDIGGFFIGQGAPLPYPYPTIGGHHRNKPINALDGWYDKYEMDFYGADFRDIVKKYLDANSIESYHDVVEPRIKALELTLDFDIEVLITQPAIPSSSLSVLEFDAGEIITNISEPSRNGRGMPVIGGFYINNPDVVRATPATQGKWIGGSNIYAHDYINAEWVDYAPAEETT